MIALVSCRDLPGWEVDDCPLHHALEERGISWTAVPWDASVDWSTFDLSLIRTTWDYHHHRERFVTWASRVPRLLNPAAVVRWNTEKTYLRTLEQHGVPIIETAWVSPGEDVSETLAARGWTRAFLKPVVGATAEGTCRFTDPEVGQKHLDTTGVPMLLQPYLARVEEEGELSAIWIDGQLTHAVRKIPVPGDYRVQDDHGASDEPTAIGPLRDLALQTIGAAQEVLDHPLLYARVDLLRDDAGDLRLTELELVEPSLFFRHGPHAAEVLADALLARVSG